MMNFIATVININSKTCARYLHASCSKHVNCNRSSVVKLGRIVYTRMYPTLLVHPDGSTIRLRYHEPRKIIKLPLDLESLSSEQQAQLISKRHPKEKIVEVEHVDLDFDPYAYVNK